MSLPLAFFFGGAPSTPELMLVFLTILLLFGAKRLPEIARTLGKSLEQFKRAARDVTDEIMKEEAKPPKTPTPLPPSQAFPSNALTQSECSSCEEAGLKDLDDDEAEDRNSRSENSPDEGSADAGTS